MKQNFVLKNKQIQRFNSKQIPSLKILKMGFFDLNEYINNVIETNPVAEKIEVDYKEDIKINKKTNEEINHENIQSKKEETLFDYVYKQIRDYLKNTEDIKIAEYILYSLEPSGYFKENIASSVSILNTSVKKFNYILDLIKSMEPLGVAASNLKECLSIQAEKLFPENDLLKKIISKHLEDVANGNIKAIVQSLNCKEEEIIKNIKLIKTMNPRPSNGFENNERIIYIIPDASIIVENDEIKLEMNSTYLPKLQVVDIYEKIYKETKNEETKGYLREKRKEIKEINNQVERRMSTIENVAKIVINAQKEYFYSGDSKKISPLTLSQVAAIMNVSPSTISRTINNKYFSFNNKILPFSFLFSKDIGGGVSESFLSQRIKEIIETENENKPISDNGILLKLKKEGIIITRRTVTKYRNELNLQKSAIRKVKYKF